MVWPISHFSISRPGSSTWNCSASTRGPWAKAWFGVILVAARRVAPTGKSNVSPCQLRTRTPSIAPSGEALPSLVSVAPGIDARREHGGERLAGETNADGGNVLLHRRLDDGEFLVEKRIALDFVDADRTAEHEQKVGHLGGVQIVDAGFEIAEGDAAVLKQPGQDARVLEGDMTDGDGVLYHSPNASVRRHCARERPVLLTISDARLTVCDTRPLGHSTRDRPPRR